MRVICFLILFEATAWAQLAWDHRELEFRPSPGESQVTARFTFKNVGTETIQIAAVKSSCGCTAAAPNKQRYSPGETGEIAAQFSFGERTGLQVKTILVQSNDPKESNAALTLRVWIPEIVQIDPSFLSWNLGETNASKTFKIKILQPSPLSLQLMNPSDPRYATQWKTVQDGKEYELAVTPTDTRAAQCWIFTLRTPVAPYRTFYARVLVK